MSEVTPRGQSVELLSRANTILAKATTVPLVVEGISMADEARLLGQLLDLDASAMNHVTAIKVKLERRLANLVDAGQANGQIATRATNQHASPLSGEAPKKLEEIGVDSRRLAEARAIRDQYDEADIDAIAAEASAEGREISRSSFITKPDLGDGVSHPARYSKVLLPVFADLLEAGSRILDPFAGTGVIHELAELLDATTVGVEIEPEWAAMHPDTIVGNALDLPFEDESFDAICTSPTYGNRLADHHNASDPHLRRSYTHDLGRELAEANSGDLQWGGEYRAFHEDAWREAVRVLRPEGRFVLNIKDHIRDGKWQDVTGWHVSALTDLELVVTAVRPVVTTALRQGTNSEARVGAELVIGFYKP